MLLLFCFAKFLDWLIRAPLHKSFQEMSFLDTVFGSFRYLNSGTAVGSCGKQAKHILASNELTGTYALFSCVIKCERLLSFDIMLSICIFHLKSLLTVRPRVFAQLTTSISLWLMKIGWREVFSVGSREKSILNSLHFSSFDSAIFEIATLVLRQLIPGYDFDPF